MVFDSESPRSLPCGWRGLPVVLGETVSRIRHFRLLARVYFACFLFSSRTLGLTHTFKNTVVKLLWGKEESMPTIPI
jgi:hypothetical protein